MGVSQRDGATVRTPGSRRCHRRRVDSHECFRGEFEDWDRYPGHVPEHNSNLYFEKNKYDAYSINSKNAKRNADGSVTIHFGGDPNQSNFLYTPDGWIYYVRLYKPHDEVLYGFYQFPKPQLVK